MRCTWREETQTRMNLFLSVYNRTLPKEIHRKIRSFKHIKFWKATEFHTFLCYVSIVLLKSFLNVSEYTHFLKFFCATSICLSDSYKTYLPKSRELFKDFIEESIDIYGIHSVTSNMHNLCHVTDEVERFGELNSISAYAFENELHHIKLRIKQCNKPLQQTARRFSELSNRSTHISFDFDAHKKCIPEIKDAFRLASLPHFQVFKQVHFRDFILSKSSGNEWFLSRENEIVQFEYALINDNKIILHGAPLKTKRDFFKQPFSSRYINIHISDCEKIDPKNFEVSSIKAKLFAIPFENEYVFIPLLHTLN